MAEQANRQETWLIAAWPGMGNVAVGACAYLVTKLGAQLVHELPSRDVFDVQHIEVKNGIAQPGRLPRSMFFEWRHPTNGRNLLIFIGESQPQERGYGFCHRLLEYAISRGVTRVFTFAAMATQLNPTDAPRVFGVATSRDQLSELQKHDVTILREGQISGLNGVLLAAAAEHGLPAACLLGELPYFAAAVPNPKASQAVLEVFSSMTDIDIDFTELKEQAEAVEQALLELMEKMQEAARQQAEAAGEESFSVPGFAAEDDDEDDDIEPTETVKKEPELDYATRQRIEALFDAANTDRDKAFQLKRELDRLGVFKQYENRFLDLFKKGG